MAGDKWSTIKRKLKGLGASELQELIHDLYRASPENRRFLLGRLAPDPGNLEAYLERVRDAVFPDPLSSKSVRIAEARRLISHYRLATGDEIGTTELTLTFVEAGTEQAVDLGYGDDKYFGALLRALEVVVGTLGRVPADSRASFQRRLVAIADRARNVGWGYGDAVRELIVGMARGRTTRCS